MNELHHHLSCRRKLSLIYHLVVVSLQSRDRIGTGGPVVDCSRLFDNDLPDGSVLSHVSLQRWTILFFQTGLKLFLKLFGLNSIEDKLYLLKESSVWWCILGKEHSFSLILCVFENQSILISLSRSCRYCHHSYETFVWFVWERI